MLRGTGGRFLGVRRKTALYLDPEKIAAAKEATGAPTITATIDAALDAVIAARAAREYVELLASDAVDRDLIEQAWPVPDGTP